MEKSDAETQKRDGHTPKDSQTNGQKLNVFGRPAAGETRAPSNGHGDRGPRAHSCTFEIVWLDV